MSVALRDLGLVSEDDYSALTGYNIRSLRTRAQRGDAPLPVKVGKKRAYRIADILAAASAPAQRKPPTPKPPRVAPKDLL